jgi:archaellum component FlaC
MSDDVTLRDIQESLQRIEGKLDNLEGLKQAVQDLADQVGKLTATAERLEETVGDHELDLQLFTRKLHRIGPLLQRFSDIVEHVMPEFMRQQTGMQGEIERLDRESQRAGGDK